MDMTNASRVVLCAVFFVIFVTSHAIAFDAANARASATIARDVNGISLGDDIHDVGRVVHLEALGGGDYDGWHEGIEYSLSATPLGRVFRIGMRQDLGNFSVDGPFIQSIEQRLFEKYGPSNVPGRNPWGWQVIEIVENARGTEFAQETNWASAGVSKSSGAVHLYIDMLDFRILWQDMDAINEGPRTDALGTARF